MPGEEDVVQDITFNIFIQAKGISDLREAKKGFEELGAAQADQEEQEHSNIRNGLKMVNHLNRLQNTIFRAAVLTGIFGDKNNAAAQSLKTLAIALDVGFAAARASLIISQAIQAQHGKETIANIGKWLSFSGPGAPLMGALIIGAIGAAVTAFAVYNSKSAAFGGVFDSPTMVVAGDSPRGPELIAPVQDILNSRGGGGSFHFYMDGKELENMIIRRQEINRLTGAT